MPEHTADLLSCWNRRGGNKSRKKWWRTVSACIWWPVWRGETGGSLKIDLIPFKRSNGIILYLHVFGVKKVV